MRIGIDISQIVYEGTGVGTYVRKLVTEVIRQSPQHQYILFGSSFRKKSVLMSFVKEMQTISSNVNFVVIPFPPTLIDFLWNILHIFPVTWFTGPLDIFWSSDWTQPPLGNTIGMTTIHDVSFLRFPESFNKKILSVQKRRLRRVIHVCKIILCDSKATKLDVIKYFHIPESMLHVIYPGYTV